jgi:hypothetical protein
MIPAASSRFLEGCWLLFWRVPVILVAPAFVVFADVQLKERRVAEAESAQGAGAGESGGHGVPFLVSWFDR